MKNISCNFGRVFMKVGALLLVSVFLTSCYVGQTSYGGEDSVYYSDKTRKRNNKPKSYGYVYGEGLSSSNSYSSNENQDQSSVRIGKKYIDPTSNASDLLYEDEKTTDNNSIYSSNNVNRYRADDNQSYTYNYNRDGWGEDGGTVINNYYYGGYSPYYSYYWGTPYWGWRSYWRPYYGWNWGVSAGWGWGWSGWGWDYPSYWGPSWGWNYPGYWRPHHHYWNNGWYCPRYYANYGSRSAYLNSSRGNSYISRSYGTSRSRQMQEIQRQNSRNAIISGSRNTVIGNSRTNNGSVSNISINNEGARNGAIIGGSRANSRITDNSRNNNVANTDGSRSGGIIRGSRNNVGIQGGSRNQVGIENSGVSRESTNNNTGTIRGSRNSVGINSQSRKYESGSSRISSPNYQSRNRENSRGSIIGGGSRGNYGGGGTINIGSRGGFGGGSIGGSHGGSIGGRR
jgi:hypothetical protein